MWDWSQFEAAGRPKSPQRRPLAASPSPAHEARLTRNVSFPGPGPTALRLGRQASRLPPNPTRSGAAREMQSVEANRTCVDTKYIRQLQREEAALMRLIDASHRELQTVRKLNPSPAPPVRPRLEFTGKKQSVVDRAMAEPEI